MGKPPPPSAWTPPVGRRAGVAWLFFQDPQAASRALSRCLLHNSPARQARPPEQGWRKEGLLLCSRRNVLKKIRTGHHVCSRRKN